MQEATQLDLDKIAKDALRASGVSQNIFMRYRSEAVIVAIVMFAVIGILGQWFKKDGPDIASMLLALPATFAFSVGYSQWRAGRREASFEKYFDRLREMNSLFSSYQVEQIKAKSVDIGGKANGSLEVAGQLRTMFIFSELDTLEYILGKLELGYVRNELAERAVRSFAYRCIENLDGFRGHVLWWIGENEGQERAGYGKATRLLVRSALTATAR